MCKSGDSMMSSRNVVHDARKSLSRAGPVVADGNVRLTGRSGMRIAATADLHFSPANLAALGDQLSKARDEADVLLLAGDLTNYGQPEEMEPLLNALVRLRVPTVAVLGNHDYESGKEVELARMMTGQGIKVLDGDAYERNGVGFAGTKGLVGGLCQEDEKSSCCTKDGGGPFGAAL